MIPDQLDDNQLWNLAQELDQSFVNQFATAMIGIGALFFAYGTVSRPFIRLMIAFIGFAGSLILWLHMYALRKDFNEFRKQLEPTHQDFFAKLRKAQSWRSAGRNRYLYWPVSRLITYSMALITWAWATILLVRFVPGITGPIPGFPTISILWPLSLLWVTFGLILAIHRQRRDIRNSRRQADSSPGSSK